jgi:hypothetical protein
MVNNQRSGVSGQESVVDEIETFEFALSTSVLDKQLAHYAEILQPLLFCFPAFREISEKN